MIDNIQVDQSAPIRRVSLWLSRVNVSYLHTVYHYGNGYSFSAYMLFYYVVCFVLSDLYFE